MSKNIKIKGLDKLIKDLRNLGVKGEQAIEDITEDIAYKIALDASNAAPTNKRITGGDLKQGIKPFPTINNMNWEVVAKPRYSAYVEFGTGYKVDLSWLKQVGYPISYAKQFQGDGIREVNIRPQPFLFPAFAAGRIKYIKDLEAELKRLTKQV